MFNDAWPSMALHMTLAAFMATAFAVAGVHAQRLLAHPDHPLHRRALSIALWMAAVTALLQPLSGDLSAKSVAERQPAKLAAMEALYQSQRGAPLVIGGIPNDETRTVDYALEIPGGLSFLAFSDFDAEVKGLDDIPSDERPPTRVVHLAFQLMVGCGMLLALLGVVFLFLRFRRPAGLTSRRFLWAVALCTPLGFIAVEAGWTVTEVGRQPWIIYGVMRTADVVSPMPGLMWPLFFSIAVYVILTLVVTGIMLQLVRSLERGDTKPEEASHG